MKPEDLVPNRVYWCVGYGLTRFLCREYGQAFTPFRCHFERLRPSDVYWLYANEIAQFITEADLNPLERAILGDV